MCALPLYQKIIEELFEENEDEINNFELCLEKVNKDEDPYEWALIHKSLGNAYMKKKESFNESIEIASWHFEKSLEIFTKETCLVDWAESHLGLGEAFAICNVGVHSQNIQNSIHHLNLCTDALNDDHHLFSRAQKLLGIAWNEKRNGDINLNVRNAIECFNKALETVDTGNSFMEWAVIHIHLAYTHRQNWNGSRQENLKLAIRCSKLALDVIKIDEAPMEWANASLALGRTLIDFTSGDLNKNAEEALRLFTRILEIYNAENMPKEWAKLQKYLGDALYWRIKGNRITNLKKSVSHYENSMAIYKKERMKFQYSEAQMFWGIAKMQHGGATHFILGVECLRNLCSAAFSKDETPLQWAYTCFHLGQAIRSKTLKYITDNERRRLAEHYLYSSLEVFSLSVRPDVYALSNLLLGNNLYESGSFIPENVGRAAECYKNCLHVWTRNEHPVQWAEANFNLGVALLERDSTQKQEDIKESIKHTELSLTFYNVSCNSLNWALAQRNLGNAKLVSRSKRKKEDIESAISYYNESLKFIEERSMPVIWAAIQMNLGLAMKARIEGKREENIEQAISHYENSLKVYNKEQHAHPWATVYMNYGNALQDRLFEKRLSNLTESIKYYKNSLEIFSEQKTPLLWAKVQLNMGNSLADIVQYTDNGNIEDAIQCYSSALRVMTEDDMPTHWADVQLNLGNAHFAAHHGGIQNNLEASKKHYENSLRIHTEESAPETWAKLQLNLGNLESRLHNLHEAAHHYNNALKIYTKEAFPLDWAIVHLNMANMFQHDYEGDSTENIEKAIGHFKESLEIFTEHDMDMEKYKMHLSMGSFYRELNHLNLFASDKTNNENRCIEYFTKTLRYSSENGMVVLLAKVHNNLGDAYLNSAIGDRSENIEMAIECFNDAIRSIDHKHPFLLAQVRVNLANAYMNRISGNTSQNLDQAIKLFNECCETITRQEMEITWAGIQMNLGNAMTKKEKPELAAEYFENALKVYDRRINPSRWATIQYNLGHNSLRFKENKLENITSAISYFEKSLEIRTKEKYPVLWAQSQLSLSIAHYRKSKILDDEAGCVEALKICRSTEQILDISEDLVMCIRYRFHEALLLSWLKLDEELERVLEKCLEVVTELRIRSHVGLLHSRVLSDDYSHVYDMKANMFLRAGNPSQALQAFESGKSYLLSSLMNEGAFLLEKADDTIRQEIQSQLHLVRIWRNKVDKGDRSASRKYGKAMQKLKEYAERLNVSHAEFYPELARFKELSQESLIRFLAEKQSGCIYFHIHNNEESSHITIFRIGYGKLETVHSAALPEFMQHALVKLFNKNECSDAEEEHFLTEFGKLLESCKIFENWGPSEELSSILIIPHRYLHNIPFSAISVKRNGVDMRLGEMCTNGLYICPSLKVCLDLHRRSSICNISAKISTGLATGDVSETPGYTSFCDAVTNLFPQRKHFFDGIKRNKGFRTSKLLLTYSHGEFADNLSLGVSDRSSTIETTKLKLGGADTLMDIWNLGLSAHLAIIVACEGARVDIYSSSDESLSIGTGFLIGGAQNVVCSLWEVHSTSAVIVICRYLNNLLASAEGSGNQTLMSRCLEEAKTWYRELNPQQHAEEIERLGLQSDNIPNNKDVRNWAAFILIGSPF